MPTHIPVMLKEVIEYLNPQDGKTYLDCTFGAGGYSKSILDKARCNVIAIDQDPEVIVFAENLIKHYPGRFAFYQNNFTNILEALKANNTPKIDGIVADLGVSSLQLNQGSRGFSFMHEGKLDMRMSQQGASAYELIHSASFEELADIIYYFGDEKYAKRIARRIIEARENNPIETTTELAEIIRKVKGYHKGLIDPATKTFQAIRIWVNKELEALERLLNASGPALNTGAKLILVSFHSLEDKIVKDYLKAKSIEKVAVSKYSKKEPERQVGKIYKILTHKPLKPSLEEILSNPRARSARLRAAVRIDDTGSYE